MPIVFESPGPYDRAISEAYGSATALKDFAPYLNRVYGGGGGGGGRVGGGGGGDGGGLRSSGGGDAGFTPVYSTLDTYAGKAQIDDQIAANKRQRQIDWINQNTGPDTSGQQGQIADLQNRRNQAIDATYTDAENQAWYNNEEAPQTDIYGSDASLGGPQTVQQVQANQRANVPEGQAQPQAPPEFTQADSLQLQRLQAGMSRVRQDAMNGNIDPGTARRMIAQIQTGIDPLKMAQQAAQTSILQQQRDQLMHQRALQDTLENMSGDEFAQHIRRQAVTLDNGAMVIRDGRGGIHTIQPPKPEANRNEITPAHRLTISNHVTQDMNRERQMMLNLPPAQRPGWMKDESTIAVERNRRIRQQVREAQGNVGEDPSAARPAADPAGAAAAQQQLQRLLGGIAMPPVIQRPPQAPAAPQQQGADMSGLYGGAL